MTEPKSGGTLDGLDELLASERNDARADTDDGLVTSAAKGSVGSLLTDLMQEAQEEVARERAGLASQLKDRADEERLAQQREEAKKREALQAQLIEETRRRNEALTRKEREEAAQREAAAPKPVVIAPETSPVVPTVAPPAKKSRAGLWAAVAVVALGGAGFGGYLFVTQPPGFAPPEIAPRVASTLNDVRGELAQQKAREEAAVAARERAEMERKLKESEAANAQLAKEAETREEVDLAKPPEPPPAEPTVKPKPKPKPQQPFIKPGVF